VLLSVEVYVLTTIVLRGGFELAVAENHFNSAP
jgi:hypothetical protein